MNPQEAYQRLVDHFGCQKATAAALVVKQPSVSAWISGKAHMSAIVAMRAERKTEGKFKAVDLCPKLKEATA